jgi:transketolase
VEDHSAEGGIADAVRSALSDTPVPVYSLAVRKKPKSGEPQQLLDFEEIDQDAIFAKVKQII